MLCGWTTVVCQKAVHMAVQSNGAVPFDTQLLTAVVHTRGLQFTGYSCQGVNVIE